MFSGSMVALVTPMKESGAISIEHLQALIDWHLQVGTEGIVILGTTGESPTLSELEREIIIQHTVAQVRGRVPVIVGTGTNCTEATIKLTAHAKSLGADAALIVTPYYNKPTQKGLLQHYGAVAESVDLPIILYNVPGRTACDLLPETVQQLAEIKQIVAIKEAGHSERYEALMECVGKKLSVLTGNDADLMALLSLGGAGVISVTANVAPTVIKEVCSLAKNEELGAAQKLHVSLMPLHRGLFVESNPIPVKWALHRLGRIPAGIRLPLTWLSDEKHISTLETALKGLVE